MNEGNTRRFGFVDFIIGLFLVIMFILLLNYFFPIGNFGRIGKVESELQVLQDRIYMENIELMQDTAREYFTIDMLPKKLNESKTKTLQEMYDKNLLLELKDEEGNSCVSSASYVKVTRLEKKYEMNTTLVCGNKSNTITSYFDLECGLSCECLKEETTTKVNNNVTPVVNPTPTPQPDPTPEPEPQPEPKTYTLYYYKKVLKAGTWSDWSEWTTEKKEADDTETKVQYKGKKDTVTYTTYYTHSKTIPGETKSYQSYEIISYGQSKTCYTSQKYVVSTYSARDCATCAITTHYVYGTKSVPYDCSTSDKYGYVTRYYTTASTTKTIETTNKSEEGYTMISSRTESKTNTVYTNDWVDKLETGYTKTDTRTLYRYRYYTDKSTTEYKTSTNPNLGDGWELIGQKTVTE